MKQIVNEELERYKKRFQTIMEFTQATGDSDILAEAEPEDGGDTLGAAADAMGGADPMAGGDPMGGGNPMGGADPMAGGDPMGGGNPMGGADPMAGGDPMGGGNPMGGADPNAQGGQGVEGLNPQGGEEGAPQPDLGVSAPEEGDDAPEEDDVEEMEEDDEVIDVDDLTKYQKKTAKGVGKISDELKDLKRLINSFEDMVNANNQGIENLRRELEKRAPNPEERINLRKTKSGPFTQNVEDYWEKDAPENYKVTSDDDIKNPKYVITKSDIDGINDWNSISKSFDEMAELNDLRNIFDI